MTTIQTFFQHPNNGNSSDIVNATFNTADWLGFRKTSADETLFQLVVWDLLFIIAVTFFSFVLVRQQGKRIGRGNPTARAFFMFPHVKRSDADKDLVFFLKYMANYGFYKFGVEVRTYL